MGPGLDSLGPGVQLARPGPGVHNQWQGCIPKPAPRKASRYGGEGEMMIVLFIVLARNKLRIPLEGTYSREM
jgi:hypothetical protein